MQESPRKDVERIFGVVQTTWKVLSSPSSLWDQLELGRLTKCIFTLHNMITEHRRAAGVLDEEDQVEDAALFGSASNNSGTTFRGFQNVASRHEHKSLKQDLVEHILNSFS
jgi:Plant transposon protein